MGLRIGGGLFVSVGTVTLQHTGGNISEPRINERIHANEVRLVGPAGEQVGIVRLEDALRLARDVPFRPAQAYSRAELLACCDKAYLGIEIVESRLANWSGNVAFPLWLADAMGHGRHAHTYVLAAAHHAEIERSAWSPEEFAQLHLPAYLARWTGATP